MRVLEKVIVHCSATPEGRDIKMETVKSWHVKGKGWRDIGYHYVIELDGTIREGRPLAQPGAHTIGQNLHSIGVCYIGGLDRAKKAKDTRTPKQDTALTNLLIHLRETFGATIHGHNEFANKACPSFNVSEVYGWINEQDFEG